MQKNEENLKYLHLAFRKHLLEEDLPCCALKCHR